MINNFTQQLEKFNIPLSKLAQQRKKWELEETLKYYEFVQKFKETLEKPQKKINLNMKHLGGSVVEHLPLAQGVIPGS